jgi:hypothetical protein
MLTNSYRLMIAVIAVLVAFGEQSRAGDWSIDALISEKFDLNDNSGLAVKSPGYVFNPTETLKTNFSYAMPDGKFDIIAEIVRRDYFGPGKGNAQDLFLPSIQANFNRFGPRSSIDISAKYSETQVPFFDASLFDNCTPIPGTTLVDCDGVITDPIPVSVNGHKQNFNVTANYKHNVDPRDSVFWNNSLNYVAYSALAGDNYYTYGGSFGVNRRLTKQSDGNLKFGLDVLSIDNTSNFDRFSYSLKGVVTTRLNPRVTMRTGASVQLADTFSDDLLLLGTPRILENRWSGTAQLGFDVLLNNTSSLAIDETLTTTEQADHSFLNRSTTALSIAHEINQVSSIKFATVMTFGEVATVSGTDMISSFSFSPTYSLNLSREWNLAAAYKFSLRNSQFGTANSNDVSLTLSHNFVVMH